MSYTHLQIALASIEAGQIDVALEEIEQHLAESPLDPEGLRVRAAILARFQGRETDALHSLDALAHPTSEDHLLRARLYEQLGDFDAALWVIERLWQVTHQPTHAQGVARLLLKRGDAARALRFIDTLPDAPTWHIWRGDCHEALGQSSAAISEYQIALERLPDDPFLVPVRTVLQEKIARLSA